MTQYGFFIDQSRCIGCNQCTLACMQWHDIRPGSVKWMRVHQWEAGDLANLRLFALPLACFHCQEPLCIQACPTRALHKEPEYGAVLLDAGRCRGHRRCWKACPYGSPQFNDDAPGAPMSKCSMCVDRLREGLKPICVLSCSMRALEFDRLDNLRRRYGERQTLEGLPSAHITRPAVVFKAAVGHRKVVSWNADAALALWRQRTPNESAALPMVFAQSSDVKTPSREIIGRPRLILKPETRAEFMKATLDDE